MAFIMGWAGVGVKKTERQISLGKKYANKWLCGSEVMFVYFFIMMWTVSFNELYNNMSSFSLDG